MTAYGVSRRVENHLENHVAVEAVSRFPYVGGITLDSHPLNNQKNSSPKGAFGNEATLILPAKAEETPATRSCRD